MSNSVSPLCRFAILNQLQNPHRDSEQTATKIKNPCPPPKDLLTSFQQELDLHPSKISFRPASQSNATNTDQSEH